LQYQFLEGIWFLHEHRIAHLDLKPANVLLGYADSSSLPRISIIDFGISIRVKSEETMVEGYCGTPFWSAPEVGTECEPKKKYSAILADQWSCRRVL
ncbi:kinase-like domain-containing protein, partial [Lactarius pseudohatsudake]